LESPIILPFKSARAVESWSDTQGSALSAACEGALGYNIRLSACRVTGHREQKGAAVTEMGPRYTRACLRDYLQWDVATWQHALYHWDEALSSYPVQDAAALELGARDGGLSLYLAHKGMRVVCSDLHGPSELAHQLHAREGLADRIRYQAVNATDIAFEDCHFDVVIFKSILGGIGTALDYAAIQTAIGEIYRVLKPGGLVLFAENQKGSRFHQRARRLFVPWGTTWYYVSLSELEELFVPFASLEMGSYGFFSCVRKDCAPLVALDRLLCRASCSPRHYMVFGHAIKEEAKGDVKEEAKEDGEPYDSAPVKEDVNENGEPYDSAPVPQRAFTPHSASQGRL
jgi:SAM-dependent methyltransferase